MRSITVAPAEQRTVASTIDVEGNIVPVTTVAITPKQTGRVESLPVDVGVRS